MSEGIIGNKLPAVIVGVYAITAVGATAYKFVDNIWPDFGLPSMDIPGADSLADKLGFPPRNPIITADGKIDSLKVETLTWPVDQAGIPVEGIDVGEDLSVRGRYEVTTNVSGKFVIGKDNDTVDPQYYIAILSDSGTPNDARDDRPIPFNPNDPSISIFGTSGEIQTFAKENDLNDCIDNLQSEEITGGCEMFEGDSDLPGAILGAARNELIFSQSCLDSQMKEIPNVIIGGADTLEEMGERTAYSVTIQHRVAHALVHRFAELLVEDPEDIHMVVEVDETGIPVQWRNARDFDLGHVSDQFPDDYTPPDVYTSGGWCWNKSGSRSPTSILKADYGELSHAEFYSKYYQEGLFVTEMPPLNNLGTGDPLLDPLSTAPTSTTAAPSTTGVNP